MKRTCPECGLVKEFGKSVSDSNRNTVCPNCKHRSRVREWSRIFMGKMTCRVCDKDRVVSDYDKKNQNKCGLYHTCRQCRSDDYYNTDTKEKKYKLNKKYHATGRPNELMRKYYTENPLKAKARAKVQHAIRLGELARPTTCDKCLKEDIKTEAHHYDYSKPLEVSWYCKKCHKKVHMNLSEIKELYDKE